MPYVEPVGWVWCNPCLQHYVPCIAASCLKKKRCVRCHDKWIKCRKDNLDEPKKGKGKAKATTLDQEGESSVMAAPQVEWTLSAEKRREESATSPRKGEKRKWVKRAQPNAATPEEVERALGAGPSTGVTAGRLRLVSDLLTDIVAQGFADLVEAMHKNAWEIHEAIEANTRAIDSSSFATGHVAEKVDGVIDAFAESTNAFESRWAREDGRRRSLVDKVVGMEENGDDEEDGGVSGEADAEGEDA